MSDTFTCENCGDTSPKGWTDDEARAEAGENGFDLDNDDMVVVCDDCYQRMVAWKPPAEWVAEQTRSTP